MRTVHFSRGLKRMPKNVSEFYLLTFILVLPLTSIYWMPSNYRPLGLLCAFLYLPFYLHSRLSRDRVSSYELASMALVSYAIVLSMLYGLIRGEPTSYSALVSGQVPLVAGMLVFVTLLKAVSHVAIEKVIVWIDWSYRFFIAVAILELLLMQSGMLDAKATLNVLFSATTGPRLQATTREASWAARLAMLGAVFYFSSYSYTGKKAYVPLGAICAGVGLFTGSLEGVLIVLVGLVFWALISGRARTLMFATSGIAAISVLTYWIARLFIASGGKYYFVERMRSLLDLASSSDVWSRLLYIDGSVFVRISYPFVALRVFLDNLLGVGPGNYPVEFNRYLTELFPQAPPYDEVFENFANLNGDPRNLIMSFAAILGLPGLIYLCWLLLRLRKELKQLAAAPLRSFLLVNICFVLASTMQFGSFAYVQFWLWLALGLKASTLRSGVAQCGSP